MTERRRHVSTARQYLLLHEFKTKRPGDFFLLSPESDSVLESAVPLWTAAQKDMEDCLGMEDCQAILRISGKLQRLKEQR